LCPPGYQGSQLSCTERPLAAWLSLAGWLMSAAGRCCRKSRRREPDACLLAWSGKCRVIGAFCRGPCGPRPRRSRHQL